MSVVHPFFAYSREICAFRLGGDVPATASAAPAAPADSAQVAAWVARTLRAAARNGSSHLIMTGLGSGAYPSGLAASLPPGLTLTVCESEPESVRRAQAAGFLDWWRPDGPAQLLADISPWSALWLLFLSGRSAANTLAVSCPDAAKPLPPVLHQLRQALLTAEFPGFGQYMAGPAPLLSCAAILSPDEPDLPGFFASLPDLAREAVLVWDGESVPERAASLDALLPGAMRPVHLARPLGGDFAAQRNVMLAACSGTHVLYLDADERLCPKLAALLPDLLRLDVPAFALARRALAPDAEACLAGYGLWPDPQVRLFRRQAGVRFVRPVHERLEGLGDRLGLVLTGSILHCSYRLKGREELRAKLDVFDAASGGRTAHRLNAEYPRLPLGVVPDEGPWPVAVIRV